jgi:hypothetical protein
VSTEATTADQAWDELSEVERLAATIYNARAQSPQKMTAERWQRIKTLFGSSARSCLDEARQMLEDGA